MALPRGTCHGQAQRKPKAEGQLGARLPAGSGEGAAGREETRGVHILGLLWRPEVQIQGCRTRSSRKWKEGPSFLFGFWWPRQSGLVGVSEVPLSWDTRAHPSDLTVMQLPPGGPCFQIQPHL